MKPNSLQFNPLLGWVLAVNCFAVAARPALAQPDPATAISVPAISAQPADQTVAHGANAVFTVSAPGGAMRYQWLKDGLPLADYGNVAGAQADTLRLVGVAQCDAGNYAVVIQNEAGAVTSRVAVLTVNSTVVFSDDFESGTVSNWTAFGSLPGLEEALRRKPDPRVPTGISRAALSPEATALTISSAQNHTPGGSQSAFLTDSRSKMFRNLGLELAGRAKATFWIYDDGDNRTRCYGELRGYTGAGHGLYRAPGGMKQLLAIGCYGVDFGTNNNTGALAGETVDAAKYQGRVLRGKNTGWFNLNAPGAPGRSPGWHQFEIEREADGTTIHFRVDGVLGRTITGADHVLLDCVTIGSIGGGSGVGNAWFDDVQVEAFPWRFDWQSKDSTGKGLPDWMRLRETGDEATVAGLGGVRTVAQADRATFQKALGNWANGPSGLRALDLRGAVDCILTAPADDAYRIEVEGREANGKKPAVKLPLVVSVDGEYLGRVFLPYDGAVNGVAHCFTPFLRSGPHTVRVYWDNVESDCALQLEAVRLQTLDGGDANRNGVKDWVENRLLAQHGIEVAPATSAVSPACIEGRGQHPALMDCRAGVAGNGMVAVPIQPGPGNRWYANVPLLPDSPTQVHIHYQNGAMSESRAIRWRPTNLLEARDLTLRKGDALLLTAVSPEFPEGQVTITVGGVTNYTTDAITPVVHRFNHPGVFTVTGSFVVSGRFSAASRSRSITVKVVEAAFDGPVAAWVAKGRFWDCSSLPPEAVLEYDPRLKVVPISPTEHRLQLPDPPPAWNGRQYRLTNDAAEARYIVARLGDNGPILASTVVQGFRLFNCYDTYLKYVQIFEDGSQLIEEAFVLSPVLPDLTVVVRIIVSGVTFDDGTLVKTLTARDFDDLGVCRVRYVRAAGIKSSVCHTTKAYQDGMLVGWPAYEK